MTTAVLANAALGIQFSLDALIAFFSEYEEGKGKERNVSASSYEAIVNACHTYKRNFFIKGEPDPVGKCHGRIKYPLVPHSDGRMIVEELEIRRDFLEEILGKKGFPNIRTCARAWKAMDVLDYETGRLTRSRKIDEYSEATEDVFVFRVFEDQPIQSVPHPKSQLVKLAMKGMDAGEEKGNSSLSSQMAAMLSEEGEDD